MIKQQEVRRFAEFVDNNLETFLPGAKSVWQQHYNLVQKALQTDLMPQELYQLNSLADVMLQTEAAMVPHFLKAPNLIKGWHPIYEISGLIQKKNWMPRLAQSIDTVDRHSFHGRPFSDQIQAVLLYAFTNTDPAQFAQILSTPCLGEQKFEPGKTVRFLKNFKLPFRN